jgi:hypothetical protein
MADIYKPYTGANIIKVDGVCYEWVEFAPNETETPSAVQGEYASCSICHSSTIEAKYSYLECTDLDLRYNYLECTGISQLLTTTALFVNIEVSFLDSSIASWSWGDDDNNITSLNNNVSYIYDNSEAHIVQYFNTDPHQFKSINCANSGVSVLNIGTLINIETLICNDNNLPESQVDEILSHLVSHGLTGGEVDISDNVPPSSSGYLNVETLISRGWNVDTD